MKIYAIKDTVVGGFMQPFIQKNDIQAKRSFGMAVNDGTSEVWRFYENMELYCLGEWNEETGVITPAVKFMCNGAAHRKEV